MSKPLVDPETKQLIAAGFLKKIDAVLLVLVLAFFGTGIYGYLHDGAGLPVYAMGAGMFLTLCVWAIILHFRVMYFLFEVKKDISDMTESSARKAVQFFQQNLGG